jgi:RNA polymerase sigma-70 factor (ECF subfamily)
MVNKQGSTAHFDEMYERCAANIIRYLRRRVAYDDVEDLAAEIFTVAWMKMTTVTVGEEMPWLYRISQHHVGNYRRKHRATPFADQFVESNGEIKEQSLASLSKTDKTAEEVINKISVIQALDSLSDEDRELLLLVAWEGCSSEELALVLNCKPTAARKRLMRARSRFASALA